MFIFTKIVPIAHVFKKFCAIFVADELDLH